jgi:cob(I)alamin adenosyltransferase
MTTKAIRSISTQFGDKGKTQTYSLEVLPKTDLLFEALGAIDELSSALGLAWHHAKFESVLTIQSLLQTINSLLAVNPDADPARFGKLPKISAWEIEWIEGEGESLLAKKPLEPRFVLPGSETSLAGAHYDVARAIARRAERAVIRFAEDRKRKDLELPLVFLNRLSDYLFLVARSF